MHAAIRVLFVVAVVLAVVAIYATWFHEVEDGD